MVARGLGKGAEAAAIFREVLAQRPELTRVRFELARTLFELNEDESARHNFELVLGGSADNPQLQQAVRGYVNAIEGRRRWDFSSFLTIAPSTNVNHGASSQSILLNGLPFQLDDANVQKSGVGISAGFQAGYRIPLGQRLDLVLGAGGQTTRYREIDANSIHANVSIGPKWRFDKGYFGVYAVADQRWMADADYGFSYGGLLSGGFSLGPQDLLAADTGCSNRRFSTDWQNSDLSYQDGYGCFVSGRYEHHFDSSTYLRVLGNFGLERTGRTHLDNVSKGTGLGLYHEFAWGISLYAQGSYTQTAYQGDFPGFSVPRQDDRYDVSINLTKRDLELFGLAPMLRYTYSHNDSNIPFNDYDEQGVAVTLTKRF